MVKKAENLKITGVRHPAPDFYVIDLYGGESVKDMRPGQFVEIKIEGSPSTFLRRPVSIYSVDTEQQIFSLLIKVAGKGTEVLSHVKEGEELNLIYPLGNSFSVPGSTERVLLIGGGVGIAPMLFLASEIRKTGLIPDILLGFRSSDKMIETDEFRKYGNLFIATEDGSFGEKGLVTGHSCLEGEKKYDRVYCCGPEAMMKAVAAYCLKNNILCEVSLENLMACGFGVCLCCIVDTVRGNLCTCTDGPVFDIKELKW